MTSDPIQSTAPWWRRLLCVWKHDWEFRHSAVPKVVVCRRCGQTDPMPYGDQRLPYL